MPETKVYYLIGMMGVGKSSIGLGAARKLDFSFIDLDDYIRKSEKFSLNEIFKKMGEQGFRELEKKYLRSLNFDGMDNMDYMNDNGTAIWLETSVSEIVERLKDMQDDRPLISSMKGNQLELQLQAMYDLRLPEFEKAKLRLENVGYDYQVIEKLVSMIEEDSRK